MSLTTLSNNTVERLRPERLAAMLWISGAVLFVLLLAATLFGRLGLPLALIAFGLLLAAAVAIVVLGWFGRTMTSVHYFFAERTVPSAASGFSGGADWAGGAFILIFMSLDTFDRTVMAPAVMFGIFLTAILFASAFFRSGVSTLPGYFSWRFPRAGAGFLSIPIVSAILLAFVVAEFAVARDVLALLIPAPLENITWAVLLLAVIPVLLGGWLSLLFANLALILAVMVCVLVPTLLIGGAPGLLQSDGTLSGSIADLPIVSELTASQTGSTDLGSVFTLMLVLSAGFSVLPHALSRLALVDRPVAASEHVGWAALFVFVLISTTPLSFGLIMGQDELKLELLASQPVLHVMPYIALLLLSYNGLAATLMAFSAGLVRGVQRSRSLDPGERSMVGTRLVAILVASSIGALLATDSLPIIALFIGALCLGAAALFVPLVSAIWLSRIPSIAYSLSIAVGTGFYFGTIYVFCVADAPAPLLQTVLNLTIAQMTNAAAIGMIAAAVALVLAMLLGRLKPELVKDPMLAVVRGQI